jgi:hypothetical protein
MYYSYSTYEYHKYVPFIYSDGDTTNETLSQTQDDDASPPRRRRARANVPPRVVDIRRSTRDADVPHRRWRRIVTPPSIDDDEQRDTRDTIPRR